MRKWLQSLFKICLAIFFVQSWLSAQTSPLPNPIPCKSGLPIRDHSCPENLPVGDPDEFDIEVTNAPGVELGTDVYLKEVRLLIRHSWVGDLDITLVSPGGRTVLLMSDVGGGDDDIGQYNPFDCSGYVSFSITSCIPIEADFPPFPNGPYLPEESLFNFNDERTNPNGVWTLQICDDVIEDGGTLEYFELVFEPITCLPLQEARVAKVDTTTVILDWLPADNCGPIIVEYGEPGFRPGIRGNRGQGEIAQVNTCAPFALERLEPDTYYEIYLRNFCPQSGLYSTNSCPILVKTGCLPPPPSLITDFDTLETCGYTCGIVCDIEGLWQNDQEKDDFDWLVASAGTPTNGTGPEADVSGDGKYIYLEATGSFPCAEGGEAYLVSNCIQLNKKGADTCHLSFNYHMLGFQTGQLRLEVSEDGGFSWRSIWQRSGSQGNQWNKVYLALSDFEDGANLQFRFVGVKGNGSKGDIALDEIVFYGSEDLGSPDREFFVDADNDGYGDPGASIFSCAALTPEGYVDNDLDCDDADPDINPGMPEIPCDGIDNNCNGMADDAGLPPPPVQHDTICSGQQAMICATPSDPENFILWYGSPDGDDIVGPLGACFFPELSPNNSPARVVHKFYAEELGIGCRSVERTEVVVVVNPNPNLVLDDSPRVCPGQLLDLNSVPIEDANFTGGVLTFSDTFPFTPEQALDTNLVDPLLQPRIYYQIISPSGCVDQDSFDIQLSSGPSLSFFPARELGLCNEGTQTVKVQVDDGNGPFQYLWENGEQSDSLAVQAPDEQGEEEKIGVRVTDVDGCVSTDTVVVSSSDGLVGVQRSVDPVSQCGGQDGQIEITPLSGAPPFRFIWSGTSGMSGDTVVNESTFLLDGLSQGAYDLTITDGSSNSCEFVVRSVLVNGPDAVLNPPIVQEVSCAGASDGEICIDVELGVNPQFLWSTGDTTACIDSLPGGFYSVTVTEGNCQNIIENIEIEEAEPLKLVFDPTSPSCADSNDGRLAAEIFGGKPDFSYRWSNGQNTETLENVTTGLYKLTVTDDNGCTNTDSVLLRAPDPLRIFLDSLKNISCFGDVDGSIRISTIGGRGPYHYEWSNGVQAPVLQDLERGDYTISVTDFNACIKTETFSIREPGVLEVELAEMAQPLCIGDNTGNIAVDVSGGTRPYTYTWNNGGQDSVLMDLGVGRYELLVMDASGCFADTFSVNLTATSVLDLNASITQPDCIGKENGQIELQPQGTMPFEYTWENGETGNSLTELGVGTYPLTITDADGCIYDTTIVVEAPQAIEAEIDLRPPACAGGSDGLISLNVDGNLTAPVQYDWNDGSTQKNRSDLSDGQYVLTITDGNSCRLVTDTLVLKSPEPLVSSILDVGPIKCKGEATGFIELQTTGGVPPYRFDWDDIDQTTESVFDLPAGEYRVQVRDDNDCSFETTVRIEEPQTLEVGIDLNVGDICSGDTTNLLDAEVAGGTPPFKYLWNNGKETESIRNVAPGDYSVEVTDANNCAEVAPTIKVKDASIQLELDSFYAEDISCYGASDGKLTARVSGGRAPYTFHFSNNYRVTTSEDSVVAEGLSAGRNYRVTITDRNGCVIVSERKPVNQPSILSLSLDEVRPVTCFNGADGAIFVNPSGGTGPYSYSWSNSEGERVSEEVQLDNVGPGVYSLRVEDSRGCSRSISGIEVDAVGSPVNLVDSLVQVFPVRCRGGDEGAILLTFNGGKAPYRYEWSNGSGNEDLSGLSAGSYTLTLTDDDGCVNTFPPFEITEPDALVLEPGLMVRDVSCFEASDGRVQAMVQGGLPPYNLSWLKGQEPLAEEVDTLAGLEAGSYTLVVTDQNDCRKEQDFEVLQPDSLKVQINIIPPVEPDGEPSLRAVAFGGSPDYSFMWSNGEKGVEIMGMEGASFSVTVEDANNCVAQDTVFLTSVFESEQIEEVKVFPNPATDQALVEVMLTKSSAVRLEMFDLSGRQLLHQPSGRQRAHRFELDVGGWNAGEYLIRIRQGNEILYAGKLVVIE